MSMHDVGWIDYVHSTDGISAEQLNGFFEGWPNPPSPDTHLKLLRQSQYVLLALDSEADRVVGFITGISDGVLCAYIPLLEVLPGYRNLGIGRELTQRMLSKLSNFYMVDLLCDRDLQPFYRKFGMHPSQGMLHRNYAKQSGQ